MEKIIYFLPMEINSMLWHNLFRYLEELSSSISSSNWLIYYLLIGKVVDGLCNSGSNARFNQGFWLCVNWYELEHYGIRCDELELFKSYLSNRVQCVSWYGADLTFLPVTNGVPQGSILGHILFLIHINDLSWRLIITASYSFGWKLPIKHKYFSSGLRVAFRK